ncbi:MAG TPA: hypothetical protein VME63_03185 [Dyella sp.]|uniref:hypothetical protein n=1 Tax=Dyella sp. TaxID=1869338 RepID=UPI002C7CBC2F|nr:hypothetical protein [Dyella sp.]HTV84379.1 hypothetical protein [Dyella sp.]
MTQQEVPDDSGATTSGVEATPKSALAGIDLKVTPNELKQPGVQKLLIDRLYKAETELESMKKFREKYHDTREQLIAAESAQKRYSSLDSMQSSLLGVGCLVLGFLPYAWEHWAEFILIAIAGFSLLGACLLSKRSNK